MKNTVLSVIAPLMEQAHLFFIKHPCGTYNKIPSIRKSQCMEGYGSSFLMEGKVFIVIDPEDSLYLVWYILQYMQVVLLCFLFHDMFHTKLLYMPAVDIAAAIAIEYIRI